MKVLFSKMHKSKQFKKISNSLWYCLHLLTEFFFVLIVLIWGTRKFRFVHKTSDLRAIHWPGRWTVEGGVLKKITDEWTGQTGGKIQFFIVLFLNTNSIFLLLLWLLKWLQIPHFPLDLRATRCARISPSPAMLSLGTMMNWGGLSRNLLNLPRSSGQ